MEILHIVNHIRLKNSHSKPETSSEVTEINLTKILHQRVA